MARRDVDKLQAEIEELFADLWHVPRFSGRATDSGRTWTASTPTIRTS